MAVIDGSLMVTEERHVASAMPSWPDGVEGTLAKRSRLMLNSVDADPQLIAGWQPFFAASAGAAAALAGLLFVALSRRGTSCLGNVVCHPEPSPYDAECKMRDPCALDHLGALKHDRLGV
jgi:hypothetical protein